MKQILISLIFITLLSGCATRSTSFLPKKVESKPQASVIVLDEEYQGKYKLFKYTLPAGEYRAVRENKNEFFYISDSPVRVFDLLGPNNTLGGIYWRKDEEAPTGFFYASGELLYEKLRDENIQSLVSIEK